jgi:NedA-like, galactose-binding domain
MNRHFVTGKSLAVFLVVLLLPGISGMAFAATDVALGGTATQSSTHLTHVASLAINGNTSGDYPSGQVANTESEYQPWWQVDLGNDYRIDSIVLWNRTDAVPERLTNFTVSVLDASNNVVWSQVYDTAGEYPNPSQTITPPANTYGQKVEVQLNGTNYLQLAEVQVFGIAQSAVPSMTWWGMLLLGLAGLAVITLNSRKKIRA